MTARETLAWIVLCVAGAAAGSAGVIALGQFGMMSPSPVETPNHEPAIVAPAPVPAQRPTKVTKFMGRLPGAERFDTVDLSALPVTAPSDEGRDTDNPDFWSAETRPELPAIDVPQVKDPQPKAPAAKALPWQNKPAAQPATKYTLQERLDQISPGASNRLAAKFTAAKADWTVAEIGLVAIKNERKLDLYARPAGASTWTLIHRYPVLAASGITGPKLRQGDKQVPEGVYGISFLNPNSRYHVSLRVNYPNAFDRQMAEKEGRKNLGGDIMIHGKAASIGCLAIGDEAAEELFVLAARTGLKNIKLVIAPADFRRDGVLAEAKSLSGKPAWVPGLYTEIATAMAEFPAPAEDGLLSFFKNLASNAP